MWVQLYYKHEGKEELDLKGVCIDIERSEITNGKISGLGRRLKDHDMKNSLSHCDRSEIYVYLPGTTSFPENNAMNPGDDVPAGTTPENPLIAVARAPPDGEKCVAFGSFVYCQFAHLPFPPSLFIVIQDGIQQPPLLPESTIAALNEMANDYVKKKRTIRLSDASLGAKTDLMDMLRLPEKGASWPNKPSTLQHVNGHLWLKGDEDSEENRLAYMAYLRTMLQIPGDYDLADVQPERALLSVELFGGMTESRKVSGTTDVAIAKSQHVRNRALRNNIETLLELKSPKNMKRKDHSPQVIIEHFAASFLNPSHAVVSVLTDLNARWIFFWYAFGDDDSILSLHKLDLNGDGAAAEAKYLLDSLYDNSVAYALPTTFAERQPFQALLKDLVQQKKARIDLDDHGHNPHQDSKPSASGGTEGYPGSNAESSSERKYSSANQGSTGGDGSAPMSMAHALSLFAPGADRDIANELDLLDMVSQDEQYEIVSSFATKHIIPYMRG